MRPVRTLTLTAAALLMLAPPALAGDNGEGLAGETNDKVVTFFSLGVLVFFTLFIVLMSLLHSFFERRKEEKKAAARRPRVGW